MSVVKQYRPENGEISFSTTGITYLGVSIDEKDYLDVNVQHILDIDNPLLSRGIGFSVEYTLSDQTVVNSTIYLGKSCKYQSTVPVRNITFSMTGAPSSTIVEIVEEIPDEN